MAESLLFAPPIRLILAADKGLLRAIVHTAVRHEADLALVDEVAGCDELEGVLARTPVDLVIWALEGDDMPRACPSIFARFHRLKVLTVREDGRRSFLWELLPTRRALGELSPQQLVDVIREEFVR